jgi:hypothetical protein
VSTSSSVRPAAHGRPRGVPTLPQAGRPSPPVGQRVGFSFDWDDNLIFMPTKFVLFRKGTNEEVEVPTKDYPKVRSQLGKPGKWQDFELRAGSYRYTEDDPTGKRNYFLEDFKEAVRQGAFGPAWPVFVQALSCPELIPHITMITARHHARETMYEALCWARDEGLIPDVPLLENIWPVNNDDVTRELGFEPNPDIDITPELKAVAMGRILDEFESAPFGPGAERVLARDGRGTQKLHLWGYSDDDEANFLRARDTLGARIADGAWPHVKVTLFHTGTHTTGKSDPIVVLSPKGARPADARDLTEAERLLKLDEDAFDVG